MGWTEHYRRQAALDLVVAGGGELACTEVFGGRRELLLALQYRWSQALRGRLEVALVEAARTPEGDKVEAVARAWRRTADEHPGLRRILDEHAAELVDALAAEQRWVAFAAGLAEPGEPAAEASRIGAAFLALVRNADQQSHAEQRNPRSRSAEQGSAGRSGAEESRGRGGKSKRGGVLRRVVAAR